jgi:hypothetical protein
MALFIRKCWQLLRRHAAVARSVWFAVYLPTVWQQLWPHICRANIEVSERLHFLLACDVANNNPVSDTWDMVFRSLLFLFRQMKE